MSGSDVRLQLLKEGYPSKDVDAWESDLRGKLAGEGYPAAEIDGYFGTRTPDFSDVKNHFKEVIASTPAAPAPQPGPAEPPPPDPNAKPPPEEKPVTWEHLPDAEPEYRDTPTFMSAEKNRFLEPGGPTFLSPDAPRPARGVIDSGRAGLQASSGGLLARGRLPDIVLPEDAGPMMRIASMVGGLAGDAPAMVAGGYIGGPVGGVLGGAAGTVLPVFGPLTPIATTYFGTTIGAGAGSFALPAFIRKAMVDRYEKGEVKSFSDFWHRMSAAFLEAGKEAVIGGATAGAGIAGKGIAAGAARPIRLATAGVGEIGTMVSIGKAMEGKVPEPHDFLDAAIFIGGLHAAPWVAGKMRRIYAETGRLPADVALEARGDAVLYQDILGRDPAIPFRYRRELAEKNQAWMRGPRFEEKPKTQLVPPPLPPKFVERSKVLGPADPAENIVSIKDLFTEPPDGKAPDTTLAQHLDDLAQWADDTASAPVKSKPVPNSVGAPLEDLPARGRRGAQQISKRLMAYLNRPSQSAPLDFDEARAAAAFIDDLGPQMFDDIGLSIRNGSSGRQGQFDYARGIVTIFQKAIEQGKFASTFVHEMWHTLARYLTDKDVSDVHAEFERQVKKFGKDRPWFDLFREAPGWTISGQLAEHLVQLHPEALNDPHVELSEEYAPGYGADQGYAPRPVLRFKSTEESYRFKNLDEYFAETLKDRYFDWKDLQNESARSIWVHMKSVFTRMVQSAQNALGYNRSAAIFDQFIRGDYEPGAKKRERIATGEDLLSNIDAAHKAVNSRVTTEEPKKKQWDWNQWYTNWLDDLHPIKVFRDILAGEEPVTGRKDPYLLARLTRGAWGLGDHFIDHGTIDFNSRQINGKALKEILAPIKNARLNGLRLYNSMDAFVDYCVSKRALELNQRGITTGVPLDEAREIVHTHGEDFEPVFRDLNEYQDRVLTYVRDSGILSNRAYRMIKAANRDYVPFYRLMDDADQGTGLGGRLEVKNPIKQIKGSERLILNPMESVVKNTYRFLQLAERNRALNAMLDLAESDPANADLMKLVESDVRPRTGEEQRALEKFMQDHGMTEDPGTLNSIAASMRALRPNEISLFRHGKKSVYEVPEPVAIAVRSLDRESVSLVTKALSLPAKALRFGAVLSPDFIARNPVRDQFTAWINSENGFVPIYDMLRGFGSLMKQDQHYTDWLAHGGANAELETITKDYVQNDIFQLSRQTGLMDRVWNGVTTPAHALRALAEASENATRIGEFKRAREAGKDPFHAAYDSREVTLDFARIGAKTRALNSIIAFWNVGVQGPDRLIRAFQKDKSGTMFRLATSVTLPSLLLWWANRDDPRMEDVPRWQKDLFWILPTDRWEAASPEAAAGMPAGLARKTAGGGWEVNNGPIFRFPKPFAEGVLFGSVPERALEAYVRQNPKAWKDLGETLTGFAPNYMPTAAIPFVEQWANKSTFTGNPIVPHPMEGRLPQYRYSEYTSETAKMLGKLVATAYDEHADIASPAVLENYWRAWTGGLGMYALQLADQALYKTGVRPDPVRPAWTLADIPVVKAYVVRYPSSTAQSIQDFQKRVAEKKQFGKSVRDLMRDGEIDEALKLTSRPDVMQQMISLSGMADGLNNQAKMIRLINRNPEIKPNEKRQLIDGLYYMMIQQSRMGNKMMDQIENDKGLSGSK